MTLYKMQCDYCPGYEFSNADTEFETADARGLAIDWECLGGSKFTVCPRCLKKVFDKVLSPMLVDFTDQPPNKLWGSNDL